MKTIALILAALLILVAILLLADKNGNFYRSMLSSKSDPDAYHEKRYKTVAIPTLLICSILIITGVFTHGFKFHEILGSIFLIVFFIYLILAATWCKKPGYIKQRCEEDPEYRSIRKHKTIVSVSYTAFIFILAFIASFLLIDPTKEAIICLFVLLAIAFLVYLFILRKITKQ